MAKRDKRSNYTHIDLGIFNGVSFKLVIPSKFNKDRYPNYYIQYDGSKKYTDKIKSTYLQYLELPNDLQSVDTLIRIYSPYIQFTILPTIKVTANAQAISFNTNVLAAVNIYYHHQKKQHEIGELVEMYDYSDRNKKLNDFFNLQQNQLVTIKELNKEIWNNFRYFLLENYNIKANSTVNQYIRYVSSFYQWIIINKEIMIFNHISQLKKLDESKQKSKYKVVDNITLNAFFTALESDTKWLRLHIICLLVLENAVRPIQVYRLQAKNIHLSDNENYLTIYDLKGKRERNIHISYEATNLIKAVYNNSQDIQPTDYLLGGNNKFKKGKEVTQKDIRDLQIVKFREKYPEFNDILIYELKHTTITKIARKDLALGMKMAGHKKQSTTQIYDKSSTDSKGISRKELIDKW